MRIDRRTICKLFGAIPFLGWLDPLRAVEQHPSAVHYRSHRDGRSLFVLLRDFVRNGISHEELARILGPFEIVSAEARETHQRGTEVDSGRCLSDLEQGRVEIDYPMSYWSVRLVLCNGRLVDHDPRHFEVYPTALHFGAEGFETIGLPLDESTRDVPLKQQLVDCRKHGTQGFGLACSHVAHAIDSGKSVGFFWGDDVDGPRPDAWCYECEQRLLAVAPGESTEQWFLECDFKILCVKCWDLAKQRLYENYVAQDDRRDFNEQR